MDNFGFTHSILPVLASSRSSKLAEYKRVVFVLFAILLWPSISSPNRTFRYYPNTGIFCDTQELSDHVDFVTSSLTNQNAGLTRRQKCFDSKIMIKSLQISLKKSSISTNNSQTRQYSYFPIPTSCFSEFYIMYQNL